MANWIETADEGLIVFSMGSMVRSMHHSKSEIIARALARLPQKVIWRYAGETPKGLGKNTKIMEWIPQNDLIGHPKTKLFITHGGKPLKTYLKVYLKSSYVFRGKITGCCMRILNLSLIRLL